MLKMPVTFSTATQNTVTCVCVIESSLIQVQPILIVGTIQFFKLKSQIIVAQRDSSFKRTTNGQTSLFM